MSATCNNAVGGRICGKSPIVREDRLTSFGLTLRLCADCVVTVDGLRRAWRIAVQRTHRRRGG